MLSIKDIGRAAAGVGSAVGRAASGAVRAVTRPSSKVKKETYRFSDLSQAQNRQQREHFRRMADEGEDIPKFSVIVTAYEPSLKFFDRTLVSVLNQTYGSFELIIADISLSESVAELVGKYEDDRIRYYHISANSDEAALMNDAAVMATGHFITRVYDGDYLTPDALYEAAMFIMENNAEILYSDEDRCDAWCRNFSDPDRKPDFSIDSLFAGNYIGNLLVIRRELFLALRYRIRYDGAMAYDLLLRAPKSGICHIPRVLYHRSDVSEGYSREDEAVVTASRDALSEYFEERGIRAEVTDSRFPGFLDVRYDPDIFSQRSDVGVVGGRVLSRSHKILYGMYNAQGKILFRGWEEEREGPQYRAQTVQNAYAVDVRCMKIRTELKTLYRDIFGVPYEEHMMREDDDSLSTKSIRFCRRVRELGYLIVWDPSMITVM